jgi:hypothetical protein
MPWPEQSGDNTWRVRYRRDDTTIGSIPAFPSEKDADAYIADMEAEQRKGTWIDPTAGQTTVAAWVTDWIEALDIDQRTEENYRSFLNKHILPRWGTTALADITNLKAQSWAKKLRSNGLAVTTVASIIKPSPYCSPTPPKTNSSPPTPSKPAAEDDDATPPADRRKSGQNPPKSSTSPTKSPRSTGPAVPFSSSPPHGPAHAGANSSACNATTCTSTTTTPGTSTSTPTSARSTNPTKDPRSWASQRQSSRPAP